MDRELTSPNVNNTESNIDVEVLKLTRAIQKAQEGSIPKSKFHEGKLPHHIQQIIREKNKIRRQIQSPNIDVGTRIILKMQMYTHRQTISKEIKKWKNYHISTTLKNIKPYDSKLYVNINKITKKEQHIPPLTTNDNRKVYLTRDKAEILADVFQTVHTKNMSMGDVNHDEMVKQTVKDFLEKHQTVTVRECDACEVNEAISCLKNNKAPGKFKIMTNTIKHLSSLAILMLTNIIHLMLVSGTFPECWKTANILAFVKPGKDSTNLANYRSISLLPTLSKIAEKIISSRLMKD